MGEHRPAIVGDENPAFAGRACKDLRIAYAFQLGIDCRCKVDCRCPLANAFDDGKFKVGIRLKANAQARGSPILARAR